MSEKHRVLVVDDDDSFRRVLSAQLEKAGQEVVEAINGRDALEKLDEYDVDLILTDLQMPEVDGLELLKHLTTHRPEIPVIILTAFATIENAIEALRRGASDYLTKPFEREELLNRVSRFLEIQDLQLENRRLKALIEERYDLEGMVGKSGRMQEVYRVARRVAATDSTVLIYGESGTGKELLARAIHANSRRADKAFVPINCGAIPAALLESELFGHTKGSFTGATRDKEGKFQAADGGTVFLDEVAELPTSLQAKLLRVLQEHTIDRVGSEQPTEVDVRILAATNRDLQDALAEGTFREDLYYRLNVVPIMLPPLRARPEDIPLLFDHFLTHYIIDRGLPPFSIDPEVYEQLLSYSWPGNVRELQNLVERLLVLTEGDRIGPEHLPGNIDASPSGTGRLIEGLVETGVRMEDVERGMMLTALQRYDWNQTRAARSLGITRNTLIYRIRKYGLTPPS